LLVHWEQKGLGVRGWLLQGEEQGALPTSAASSPRAQDKLHGAGRRCEKALEWVTLSPEISQQPQKQHFQPSMDPGADGKERISQQRWAQGAR